MKYFDVTCIIMDYLSDNFGVWVEMTHYIEIINTFLTDRQENKNTYNRENFKTLKCVLTVFVSLQC